MLIQFNFKNFKSFRDETILDLSATKITEHEDRAISIGNEKLLTAAAIFGANASGKSNVVEAFRYMTLYVQESFAFGGESDDKKSHMKMPGVKPFLFDGESINKETLFETYFVIPQDDKEKTYNYGFTLNKNGVVEEWLNYKSKTAREYKRIFFRNEKEIDMVGLPKKSQENIKIALEKETLIVSLGAKLKIAKLKVIRDWFQNNEAINFGNVFENFFVSNVIPNDFAEKREVQKKVIEYFATFDPSIIDFKVEKLQHSDDEKAENNDLGKVKIDAVHRTIDGKTATIPLEEESSGTLKMFAIYPVLQETLKKGSLLFIDELNSRLHPLLVRNFLLTFLNPKTNPNHAQIIFTTHDAWQLSNDLLRRDEIWFTEKNKDGVSTLYSLADFTDEDGNKIRKDENYERNYLLGKYGAIPTLKFFDIFKE
jgi:AAA15 family ATPase/GTPase